MKKLWITTALFWSLLATCYVIDWRAGIVATAMAITNSVHLYFKYEKVRPYLKEEL